MAISIDGLSREVQSVLEEYAEATLDNFKKAVDKVTKQAVDDLKADSPKRTGAYAKSWSSKNGQYQNSWAYGKIIFAKDPHYRLTHLLEKGHRKVNGGFVAARPHIAKVEQEAINDLIKEVKESI